MQTKTPSVQSEVAIQSLLRPEITPVSANKDFAQFKEQIETVDRMLYDSGLEALAIRIAIENLEKSGDQVGGKERERQAKLAVKALRTNTLRTLLGGLSDRELSKAVYGSELLADFCRVLGIDGIKGLTKSTVNRMLTFFSEEQLRCLHVHLTEVCGNAGRCAQIGLEEPVDATQTFFDSTCLEAAIHYPVDWILLKDVSLTLLKAISLIRGAGIFCRMPQGPEGFARDMNKLCIEMTHSARRKNGKKLRKQVFRRMKKLLTTIGKHAERHRAALDNRWGETKYTEAQKNQILSRIDEKLGKLPQVKKQAHERIIGGRRVANAEKILSAHEPDIHVIVRRKAGKEVEFGNTLMLCESLHGYILDWKLYRGQAPGEGDQLAESLERQETMQMEESILSACTDRGFNSKKTSRLLEEKGIQDDTCPRDPAVLKERLNEEPFADRQRRRASTEGRIAILRGKQGGRLRQKGFANRSTAVAWSVLAHNLWLLARLLAQQESRKAAAA